MTPPALNSIQKKASLDCLAISFPQRNCYPKTTQLTNADMTIHAT